MKVFASRALRILSVMLLAAFTPVASAQSLIANRITTERTATVAHGRDFWIVEMSNYWGQNLGGKYMRLYISSPSNTTAFVESQGKKTPIPVSPNNVSSYLLPEFWEMESSGIVESKGIHVWSNNADITVYAMSSDNDNAAEGSFIIPTIGWGNDYVVGAYGSLFEGYGNYVYDLPSTMAAVADEDSTTISIIPSCDCRQCTLTKFFGQYPSAGESCPL